MKSKLLALLLALVTVIAPLQGAFDTPADAAEWTTDYRVWSQSDPLWGSELIGNKTMSSVGCLVVAVAKLMVHAGQRDPATFNPGICLAEMKKCNIFRGTNSMYTGMLADSYFSTYAPELTETYNSGNLSKPMTEAQAAENFRTFIDNGYYIIVMTNTVRNTTHWMTVDDVVNGHVMVMDNKKVIDLYDADNYNGVARYLLVKYSGKLSYPASAGVTVPNTSIPESDKTERTEFYSAPDQLRIRSTPSLSGAVIGGLAEGERVKIHEVRAADGYVWGRMDIGGWCAISLCTYISGSLYYVFYDANGGAGGTDSQPNPYGQAVTLSSEIPVWEGHTFLGWATAPNALLPEYSPGDSVNVDADLTLYAVWDSVRSEKYVTPDLLRVRSKPSLSASKLDNLAEGTQITVYEAVAADGYTWGRLADGGWCAISICTYVDGALNYIFYNKNGGIGGVDSQPSPTDQSVTIPSDIPMREGYTFLGYAETPDGAPVYQPGDQVKQNSDLTLYAIWGDSSAPITKIEQKNGRLVLSVTYAGNGTPDAEEFSASLDGRAVLFDPETVKITSANGLTTVTAELFGVPTVKNREITIKLTLGDTVLEVAFTPTADALGYETAAVSAYRNFYSITLYTDSEIPYGSKVTAVDETTGKRFNFTVSYHSGKKTVLTCEEMDADVSVLIFEEQNFAVLITDTKSGVNRLPCPVDRYFVSYYQTKQNDENPNLTDLRFVIVGNMEKLAAVDSAAISIVFYSGEETVRQVNGILGGSESTYRMFTSLLAAGDLYTAEDGAAIFGQQISGVPKGAFTRVTLKITDRVTGETLLESAINSGI